MYFSFRRNNKTPGTQKTSADSLWYNAVASSDVCAVRLNNEDKVLFVKPHDEEILVKKSLLGIVADGMGGHTNGEITSQIAFDLMSKFYFESNIGIVEALKKSFTSFSSQPNAPYELRLTSIGLIVASG